MTTGGDLGRRVAERRRELKLSVDQVAERAGMSATYLGLLESNPAIRPPPATMMRLASALDMTVEELSGGGIDEPPGRGRPIGGPPALEKLDATQSRALIEPGGVGRVVFDSETGPVALPVNYRCLDGDIVFRAEDDSVLVPPEGGSPASFEVDHLDDALTEGWSVLVTGRRERITDPEEAERAWSLGIVPWAGGDRPTLVRVVETGISGRRIRRRPSA